MEHTNDRSNRTTRLAWFVLVVMLGLSSLAAWNEKRDIDRKVVAQFRFSSERVALRVRERLQSYELILRSAAGVISPSGSISRDDFATFVRVVQADTVVPGVQGIGYSVIVPPDQLQAHIAAVRAEGYPTYTVWPEGTRDVYTAIVYLEPFSGRNLRAFGYDMFSEPVRRDAMSRARDSGQPALSGKVQLVQEDTTAAQSGTLMYVPVYRPGASTSTVAQRRAAIIGWTYSPFRMTDMMRGVLGSWETSEGHYVSMRIYDGTEANDDELLYASQEATRRKDPGLVDEHLTVDFYGHQWLIDLERSADAPPIDYRNAWATLVVGAAISVLVFGLIRSRATLRSRAQRLAAGLTGEIRQREEALRDSEFRWRFAVDGAGDGLWDWDVAHGTVYFSRRWKEMLGHTDDEIGNSLEEWSGRVHPDDIDSTMAAVQAYLAGALPSYVNEHRVRCKDGSYKWILDRGVVVSRDADGTPLRMIGTHKDVTDRREMEDDLRRQGHELAEAQRIAKLGSWSLDLGSGEVRWSTELYEMFRLDPEQSPPNYAVHSTLFAPESWRELDRAVSMAASHGVPYELELECRRADGTPVWMLARGEPIRDDGGAVVGLRGITMDINDRKVSMQRAELLSEMYKALSECNAAIVQCTDDAALYARVCDIVAQVRAIELAWIGVVDAPGSQVRVAAAAGRATGYLDGIDISVDPGVQEGRGPTGTAIRDGRPVWVEDFTIDAATGPWHERGARFGLKASAALPIRRNGEPVAALTVYSAARGWQTDEIRRLMEEMARNLGVALDKFAAQAESERSRQTLVEAEHRFESLVDQSMAGAYIVEDGLLVYANPRLRELMLLPDDIDLRDVMAFDFVAPPDRDSVRDEVQRLEAGEITSMETTFTLVRTDGSSVEVGFSASAATFQGRPAIVGLVQDVTSRRVAEARIRRYAQQLETTFMQTVALATTLGEMRDPYTSGHEERVAAVAVAIAEEMGLERSRVEGVRVSGYLHDVGKIAVPAEILVKPAALTSTERALIQQHPLSGHDILKRVEFPWPVADVALQHHERMDGSGYPHGLTGSRILLEARIVAVADVIESMASHRPYRPSLGIEAALAEIEQHRGRLYDEAVVDACLRVFREGRFRLEDHGVR